MPTYMYVGVATGVIKNPKSLDPALNVHVQVMYMSHVHVHVHVHTLYTQRVELM